jgi:peptidoglycan-associated lipoprotein
VVLAVLLVAATGGCHKKPKVVNPKLGDEVKDTSTGQGQPNVDLGKLNWQPALDLTKIYFDYNKFSVRPDAAKALNDNAEKMKKDPANVMFQVEGHCDERGTQEYNLALGEKRALAVRDYLIKLGISGDRIVTISYGKERSEKDGHDESAWKFNRRALFNRATK